MSRPIATFDITGRCPLRCRHCYFFQSPLRGDDLPTEIFLRRLRDVRDKYGILSAFWVGGEPLLRLRLLRRAMRLFRRNAVSTSGMVPIPPDLDVGLLISIDGPREVHDRIRGSGSFDRVMENLAPVQSGTFALSVTLTSESVDTIDSLPTLVEKTRALGAVIGFYVGPPDDPLRVEGAIREGVINRLLDLMGRWPNVVLNPPTSLELFRPQWSQDLARHCIYRNRAIAFDTHLKPKIPCTFDARAHCSECGCAVVAAQRARDLGDGASDLFLRTLFPMTKAT